MQLYATALAVLATGCELLVHLPEGGQPKLASLGLALPGGQGIPLSPSFSADETFYDASSPPTTRIVVTATANDPELFMRAINEEADDQSLPHTRVLDVEIDAVSGTNMIFIETDAAGVGGLDYLINLTVQ
jgi:hypothetical protein